MTDQPSKPSLLAYWTMMIVLGVGFVGLIALLGFLAGERGWMF